VTESGAGGAARPAARPAAGPRPEDEQCDDERGRTARVVTASSGAVAGVYRDRGGSMIVDWLRECGFDLSGPGGRPAVSVALVAFGRLFPPGRLGMVVVTAEERPT
jgi:hypothetical protein